MPRFLLWVTLAAAAATPALGQTAAIGLAGNGTQSTASIPNFAGIWAHPFFPGFEPPPSGPGPVTNRSRADNGVSDAYQFVGDYTNPILKPEAAAVVKAHGEISLAGKVYPTPNIPPIRRKTCNFVQMSAGTKLGRACMARQ